MKIKTSDRIKSIKALKKFVGKESFPLLLADLLEKGKQGIDDLIDHLGRILVETLLLMEREELSGPEYTPSTEGLYKWAKQKGSVYVGGQKIRIAKPRLRNQQGECPSPLYKRLRDKTQFSQELVHHCLRGLSCRDYEKVVIGTAKSFGISPSSVSRRIVEATSNQLKEFKERPLEAFEPFAIMIDSIHRGGAAFVVALAIDIEGVKTPLGIWEGATENHDICLELLRDLEKRRLKMVSRILFITDGGTGIIKALKVRFGKGLLHQRCVIHKDRNIQNHLAKKYRKEAHFRFRKALEHNSYEDAKEELKVFEKWLREINDSAAKSLLESFEELLTLHRLRVPPPLRKVLCSTNPIESMFSTVRECEHNIKRYRSSTMAQRWLVTALLFAEKGFRRIKGCEFIKGVIETIERITLELAV